VRMNFSSCVYPQANLSGLKAMLCRRMDSIRCYPEPIPLSLETAIARRHDVDPACVLVTNGATEAIYLVAQMAAREGIGHYAVSRPTFSEYEDASRLYGLAEGVGGVRWLCNPNNPTGSVTARGDILTGDEVLVVVDQSYEDFCPELLMSAAEAVADGHIVQIRSLTKSCGVPGLRIGYVVAAADIIGRLRQLVRPWSVNALAIEAGKWLLTNRVWTDEEMDNYLAEAQRLNRRLGAIPSLRVMPTRTHFMLVRHEHLTAADLKAQLLREHHILVRDASNFKGLDSHYFRIAAQTRTENEALVEALNTR